MKTLITSALSAVLAAVLFAAPSGALAQTRSTDSRTRSSSSTRSSSAAQNGTTTRQSSSSATQQNRTTVRGNGNTSRSNTQGTTSNTQNTTTRQNSSSATQQNRTTVRGNGNTSRSNTQGTTSNTQSTTTRQSSSSATQQNRTTVRGNSGTAQSDRSTTAAPPQNNRQAAPAAGSNVTRRGLSPVTQEMQRNAAKAPAAPAPDRGFRVSDHNVVRIPPRERGFMPHDRPGSFWGPDPHFFGWRVQTLPPRYKRVRYFGIDYYYYDNVYYRPFGGHYIVCRPPFGVVVDVARVRVKLGPVRFSFYPSVYRTYVGWDSYSRYIDEQNRIIAQNNATIAAQNAAIAMNLNAAQDSWSVASQLGLTQSYAYANQEYYYEDGVFYIINKKGRYEVIVPPAGALVDSLPEDYETLMLGGREYYRVDDTVYRMVMVGGEPCLEVLGQMYGDMARKYSLFG